MTDAEYEAQKERVVALAAKWLRPLGLLWWRKIDIAYERGRCQSEHHCIGEAEVQWEYMQALLRFYLEAVAEESDDDLEYAFVHECMHVLVKEMRWQDEKTDNQRHEERVVTMLAQAILWVRDFAKEGKL